MSVSSSEMKYDSLKDGRARAKSIEPQQYITNHSDVRSDVSSENGTDEIRALTNKKQTVQSKSNRENQFSNRSVIRADIDSNVRSLPRQPKLTRKPPFRYVYSEWQRVKKTEKGIKMLHFFTTVGAFCYDEIALNIQTRFLIFLDEYITLDILVMLPVQICSPNTSISNVIIQ